MVAAKLASVGLLTARQIFFGLYDQHIHIAEDVPDLGKFYFNLDLTFVFMKFLLKFCPGCC
jgi:hypothetical protein